MITKIASYKDPAHGIHVCLEKIERSGHRTYRVWRQIADEWDQFSFSSLQTAMDGFKRMVERLLKPSLTAPRGTLKEETGA